MRDRGAYFLHIPRTGGTTLRWILEGRFPARACALLYVPDLAPGAAADYHAIEAASVGGLSCFSSHAPLDTFPALQRDLHVITLLREPVARTISHYHHAKLRWRSERPPTLEAFTARLAAVGRDNLQVRTLSGLGSRGAADRDALERAKANLSDRVASFGVTERFDEALVLFMRLFGWRDVRYVRRNTTAHPSGAVHPSEVSRIAEQNRLDAELYAFACEVRRERLAREPVAAPELARIRDARHVERLRIYGQRVTRRLLRARVPFRSTRVRFG